MKKAERAQRRWRFWAVAWPLLCVLIAGMILLDTGRTADERMADIAFTGVPLVFFAAGMSIRRRLLRERANATAFTTAAVVSEGRSVHRGSRHFFPEFEFQASGRTYSVRYSAGYSFRIVEEGGTAGLYYNPENPMQFYIPAIQRHDRRLSLLLCGVGVLWPLLALFAPWIRFLLPI